jgi:predicted GTPase
MSAWNWKNLFRGNNNAPTQPQTPILETSKSSSNLTSQTLPTQTTSSSQTKSIHEFHLKILIVGSPGAGKTN